MHMCICYFTMMDSRAGNNFCDQSEYEILPIKVQPWVPSFYNLYGILPFKNTTYAHVHSLLNNDGILLKQGWTLRLETISLTNQSCLFDIISCNYEFVSKFPGVVVDFS